MTETTNKKSKKTKSRLLRTYEGSVVIITGGASGIGRAIAQVLADKKAQVIVLLDRQVAEAEKLAAALQNETNIIRAYEVDVRDFQEVERVVKSTKKAFGHIDFLFNNAGVLVHGSIENIGVEQFNYVMDVNVCGVSNGIYAAYPIMKEQGFGHIVNTASIGGLVSSGGMSAYGTSKYAVVGMSTNMRIEGARHGVRVSVLCPGFVQTPIFQGGGKYGSLGVPQEVMDKELEKIHPMDPKKFAERALEQVARNKPIIVVPGWPYKLIWFIFRLCPSLGMYLSRKQNDKAIAKLEKLKQKETAPAVVE